MSRLKLLGQFARSQVRNAINLTFGRPINYPPLGSMTLDRDDVDLAVQWLQRREEWYKSEPVREFEEAFASWNGSRYAYAFMSGREALSAILDSFELTPGDEVLVPGYTCVVVPNAIKFAGLVPIFYDIELETYGPDLTSIKAGLGARTRVIVIHHLFGLVCRDYEAIIALARRNGIRVIEDCAHATGASYQGVKVGNLGDAAFYSTEQSKVLSTNQGGIATTNCQELGRRLEAYQRSTPYPNTDHIQRQLKHLIINYYANKHPKRWLMGDLARLKHGGEPLISTSEGEIRGLKPEHYGRKMPAAIAAIGLNQLKKLDAFNTQRRHTAERWQQWCNEKGISTPRVVEGSIPVFLRYPVMVEPHMKRDLSWAIKELGVLPGVWFTSHLHPAEDDIPNCPNAAKAAAGCINLPCLL